MSVTSVTRQARKAADQRRVWYQAATSLRLSKALETGKEKKDLDEKKEGAAK